MLERHLQTSDRQLAEMVQMNRELRQRISELEDERLVADSLIADLVAAVDVDELELLAA